MFETLPAAMLKSYESVKCVLYLQKTCVNYNADGPFSEDVIEKRIFLTKKNPGNKTLSTLLLNERV